MVNIAEEISSQQDSTLNEVSRKQLADSMASATGSLSHISPQRPRRALIAVAAGAALLVGAVILFPVFAPVREKARQVAGAPAIMGGGSMLHSDVEPSTTAMQANNYSISSPVTAPARESIVDASPQPASPPSIPADGQTDASLERQVHKSATITVQVSDPESTGERIEDTAKAAGGFVTTSDLTTSDDGTKSYTMTVKVPLPQFESTLAQIARFGSVQDKEVTGEDITDKVSDADQRENVLESDMDQALDQLKKKGSHASWDLQEDARDLRIQLAQSRARLKLLRSLAEMSEIDVTLSQPTKPAAAVQTGFFADISSSGHGALQSAAGAVSTLIALLLWILAYSPLWLPALLIGRWAWRRYNGPYQKVTETGRD